MNKKTYAKFKEWLKRPVDSQGHELRGWHKIRDYLPDSALDVCNNKSCEFGDNTLRNVKSKTISFYDAAKIVKSKTKSNSLKKVVQRDTRRA